MKRSFFILISILMISSQAGFAQTSGTATVYIMATSKADADNGCEFFVAVNRTYAGVLKPKQFVCLKLKDGICHFRIYSNRMKTGIPISNCTYEVAKMHGMYMHYDNLKLEPFRTYYLAVEEGKCELVTQAEYEKTVARRKLKEGNTYDLTGLDNKSSFVKDDYAAFAQKAGSSAIPATVVTTPREKPATVATPAPTPVKEQPATPPVAAKPQPAGTSDVDKNIFETATKATDTYVLIIANEQYEFLDKVNFAANDGKVFREYCRKTLGVPDKQIFYYENATFGKMEDGVSRLAYCLNNFSGAKAIVYYCGHGIPDEKTGEPYLIPTDGKGTNTRTLYGLTDLYKTLAATQAQCVTYFMDACFTGANKEGSMLVAARGVARAPQKETLAGNTVVFSASSGDETAMTFKDQNHGLFTYYLLKKLNETQGEVTYGELAEYIHKNVKKDAFLINEKPQTPVVATSPAVVDTWQKMKLK